jgi:hypothetical protein
MGERTDKNNSAFLELYMALRDFDWLKLSLKGFG